MPTGQDAPRLYEIRVTGHLEPRWAAWFDGMTLTHGHDGTTAISGPVVDQAALHGLLAAVRDTGLPLVSVTQVDAYRQDPSLHTPRSTEGEPTW